VLVTGGIGSFGHRFVDIVLERFRPRWLVVFSRDELKQSEVMARFKHPSLRFFVGDVRDPRPAAARHARHRRRRPRRRAQATRTTSSRGWPAP